MPSPLAPRGVGGFFLPTMAQTLELKIILNAEASAAQRAIDQIKQSVGGIGSGVKIDDAAIVKPLETSAKAAKDAATATKGIGDAATQAATGAGSLADKFAKIGLQTAGITSLATNIEGLSKPFVELDSGLRAIGTLGVKNFQEFGDAALELSRVFPDNAATISNAVAEAVGSGIIKTNEQGKIAIDQAKGFAAQASSLALAGATDIGRATSGLASVMNSYGDSLDKYGDTTQKAAFVSDVLFNTYNLGVTSVGDLASNLSNVTGLAATAGVGIDQVGAAIATMTKQGKQTGVATTQIRSLIQELLAGKDKLAPVLKDLNNQFKAQEGVIASTGRAYDKTKTLQQNLKDGNITLQDIANGIGKVVAKQGKEITNVFGSIEAAQAVLSLSGKNAAVAMEDLEGITKRGTVAEGVDVQAGSIENRMKVLVNTVNSGFIAAFGALGDSATVALGTISKLAPTISAVTGIKQLIPEGVFTKALDGVKSLIAANGASALSFGAVGTAARAAWAAVTGPVGLAIAAVAALGAGAVLLYQNFEPFRNGVDKVFNSIANSVNAVKGAISAAVAPLKAYTSTSKEQVSAALSIAEAENATLQAKRNSVKADIEKTETNKKLVEQYIQLGKNTARSAEEQAKFNSLGEKIAVIYPGLIDRTKDFSANLGALQAQSNKSVNALSSLNAQLASLDSQIAANRQRQLAIQADSARATIDDIFNQQFRTFTGGFKGQTEQLYNEVNAAIAEVYGQKTAEKTQAAIAKLEAIVGSSVQKFGIDPRIASQLIQQVQTFGKNRVDALEFYANESLRKENEAAEKAAVEAANKRATVLEGFKQMFDAIKQGIDVKRQIRDANSLVAQISKAAGDSLDREEAASLAKEVRDFQESLKSRLGSKSDETKAAESIDKAYTEFLKKTLKVREEAEAATAKSIADSRLKSLEETKAALERDNTLSNTERLEQTIAIERQILEERKKTNAEALADESKKRLQVIGTDLAALLDKSTKLSASAIADFTGNTANLVPEKIADFVQKNTSLSVEQIKEITETVKSARAAIEGQSAEAAKKTTQEFDSATTALEAKLRQGRIAAALQDELRSITQSIANEQQRRLQTELAQLQDKFRSETLALEIAEARKTSIVQKFEQERLRLQTRTDIDSGARDAELAKIDTAQQAALREFEGLENTKLALKRQFTAKQVALTAEQFKSTGTVGREQASAFSQTLGSLVTGFEGLASSFGKRSQDYAKQSGELRKRMDAELATVGKSFKKRREVEKKYAEERLKLEQSLGGAGFMEALGDSASGLFAGIAEQQRTAFQQAIQGITDFSQIGQDAFISLGITAAATIGQVAAQGGDVGKAVVRAAFDTLQALVPVIVGQISILAFGQPDSVATFGATAGARVALLTALVQGALSIARSAAGFKEGGLVEGGKHDGKTGRFIRINEIAPEFVVNHSATAKNLTALTEINRRNITVEQYVKEKHIARTPLETSYFIDESGQLQQSLRRVEKSINYQTERLDKRLAAVEAEMHDAARVYSYERKRVDVVVETKDPNLITKQQHRKTLA